MIQIRKEENQKKLKEKKQEWKNRQEKDARFSSGVVEKILLHKQW